MNGALFILLFVVVGGGVAFGSYYLKKRRRDELAIFAAKFGLSYSQQDPYGLDGYDFKLFERGDGRGCENVLTGEWQGLPVVEADYWFYTTSSDGRGHTSRNYEYFSVLLVDLACSTPYVSITKESVFTKLADHIGFPDIAFESEAFNREFNVRSPDREFTFKLIDARMEQALLDTGGAFAFELRGPRLLVYRHRVGPMELVPLFGTAKAFVDHIPRLVWSEYGTGTQQGSGAAAPIPPPPA